MILLMLLPVNLHVSNQACATPKSAQVSLKLLLNIQVDFADKGWQKISWNIT